MNLEELLPQNGKYRISDIKRCHKNPFDSVNPLSGTDKTVCDHAHSQQDPQIHKGCHRNLNGMKGTGNSQNQ